MVAIQPQRMIGDFSPYQDLYNNIYNQKLEEFRTSPWAIGFRAPETVANAAKDVYSIWQWEEDKDRQDELDAKQTELQEKQAQEYEARRRYYEEERKRRDAMAARRANFQKRLETMTPEEKQKYGPYLDIYEMGVI